MHTIAGLGATEMISLAAAILTAGVITGLLAGLFGVGGGAVIVPVLYELFAIAGVPEAVRMQLCIGTSLAIIAPTTVRSYLVHRRSGLVLHQVMQGWTRPAIGGVMVGAAAAAVAPAGLFKAAFVVIATTIALNLLWGQGRRTLAPELPGGAAMTGYGFLIGLCASLMGVSGGSISTAILTLHGTSIHAAIATSAGISVPITIAGAIGYALAGLRQHAILPAFSVGFVSLLGVALMAPVSTLVASIGVRWAHRLSKRRLEIAFALFLLAAATRFLVDLAGE